MFATMGQGYVFLYCLYLGVLCGLLYELCYLVRFCLGKRSAITFIVDIVFAVLAGVVLVPAFVALSVDLRVFMLAAVAIGFTIERISSGYFIAKCAEAVYNGIKSFARRFAKGRLRALLKRITR